MNRKEIYAKAQKFQQLDNRLSFEVCLTEAVLGAVILELNHKGKIPKQNLIDKK